MPRQAAGVSTSPFVWEAKDEAGRAITMTVTFTVSTGVITQLRIVRATGCRFGKVYFGRGANGLPNTAPSLSPVVGTTNYTTAQIAAIGVTNISHIRATQVTAGP